MSTPNRERALRNAVSLAHRRAVKLDLPVLTGESAQEEILGLLVRDRALTLIEEEYVAPWSQRRRRSPFSDQWAEDWWSEAVLPFARRRPEASWWISRAPAAAFNWALMLDPIGAGEKKNRDQQEK